MRVLFSSMRMTGHIRPLLPYAHALQNQGHDVLFATPQSAQDMLSDVGLAHAPFDHPGDERLGEIWAAAADLPREELVKLFVGKVFADLNPRAALPKLRETINTWKPDLIVRESMEFAAAIAGQEAGIAVASVCTSNARSEADVINMAASPLDVLRAEAGLEPDGGAALRATPTFSSFPASIYGDVASLGIAPPFHVRSARHILEAMDPTPAWAVQDDRPLVFITYGTLLAGSEKNHGLIRAAFDAASALPVRVLFSTGAPMDASVFGQVAENVTITSWVAEKDIYPRASALVFHGGAGTLLAGLAHGVPMVVTPMTSDQPENGACVEAAGVGICLTEPDVPSLRASIERVLSDPSIRSAAGKTAAEIAALPDVDDAVDELQRLSLACPKPAP